MNYDLIATFYRKATNKYYAYRSPLCIINDASEAFFKRNGFIEDPESTVGYVDFTKETTEDGLETWTDNRHKSEVLDILTCGEDFEKIRITAYELDSLDPDGTLPMTGFRVGDIVVDFTGTEALDDVIFKVVPPEGENAGKKTLRIPLINLKNYFEVLTMFEVEEKLEALLSSMPRNTIK